MLLTKDFQQGLLNSCLMLDCFIIQVKQRNKIFKFSGPGTIFHNDSGALCIKVYDKNKKATLAGMIKLAFTCAKGIVPESDYFDITARDSQGRIWQCKRLYIYDGIRATPHGTTLEVELHSLRSAKPIPPLESDHASIAIRGKPKLPLNQYRTDVDGRKSLRGLALRVLDIEIDFDQKDDHLVISITSARKKLTEKYIDQLLAGLSLACGERLQLTYITIATGSRLVHHIPGAQQKITTHLPSLVPMQHGEPEYLEEFLSCYLAGKRISKTEILRHWKRLTECNIFSETSAAIVCIAIEGMIKHYHKSSLKPGRAYLKHLNRIAENLANMELPHNIQQRLNNTLSDMRKVTIGSQVREMQRSQLITKDHSESWFKLRNSTTHADAFKDDSHSFADQIALYCSCLDLFYILICKSIGYASKRNVIDDLPLIVTK